MSEESSENPEPPAQSQNSKSRVNDGTRQSSRGFRAIGFAYLFIIVCYTISFCIKDHAIQLQKKTIESYRKDIDRADADYHRWNAAMMDASNAMMLLVKDRDEASNECVMGMAIAATEGFKAGWMKMDPREFAETLKQWVGSNNVTVIERTNGFSGLPNPAKPTVKL